MSRLFYRRDKEGKVTKRYYRGKNIRAAFLSKFWYKFSENKTEKHQFTPPITVPPRRRVDYWHLQRRILEVYFVVFCMYEDDVLKKNTATDVYITKVKVVVNTSVAALPRLLEKIQPMVEQEVLLRAAPGTVIIGSIITEVRVGRKTKEKSILTESYDESRSKKRKKLREMT